LFKLNEAKYKNILDIDNMEITEGAITAILGASGSGKTTLLKLLNKLISTDSGRIYYKGMNIEEIDSVKLRREVVMLSQDPVIFDGDIRDNLLVGLKFSQKEKVSDEDLSEMLNKVKLYKGLDDSPKKLSGGERQRLALGRVMLMHPEVLLLDEPSASLDEETERLVISELAEYAKVNNKTLIMVTHSKRVAKEFAQEIITINKNETYRGKDGAI
jgi:putative ABC transport system ATP-binding protein